LPFWLPLFSIPLILDTMILKCGAVPLQQPLTRTPALAAQQFNPATGRANANITMSRRAGLGGNAPTGQGGAAPLSINGPISRLGSTIPDAQQQGGDAGGFRRQLQTPALPQIQTPHLAHHHGQAGAFQAFLHGPQALLIIPPPHQDQLLCPQAKCRQSRSIQLRSAMPWARRAPQHPAIWIKSCPPGRQHGGKGQGRPASRIAQYFVQTPTRQTGVGQAPINARHAHGQERGQGGHATVNGRRALLNCRDTPPQRRDRMPSGAVHDRPFLHVSMICSYFVLISSRVKKNLELSANTD
jgi:hypothetical protein